MLSEKLTRTSRQWFLVALSVGLALVVGLSMTLADDAEAKKKKKKKKKIDVTYETASGGVNMPNITDGVHDILVFNSTEGTASGGVNMPDITDGVHQMLVFNSTEWQQGPYTQEQGVIDYVWGANCQGIACNNNNEAVPGVHHSYYISWGQDGTNTPTPISWFISNHPDWILYTESTCNEVSTFKSTNCVAYWGTHTTQTPLDYTNPEVQQYMFTQWIDPHMTSSSPFNGIAWDGNPFQNIEGAVGHWTASGTWIAQYSGERYGNSAWQSAQTTAFQLMRNTFKSKYPNGSWNMNDGWFPTSPMTGWGGELQYADSFMEEGGFFSDGSAYASTSNHITTAGTYHTSNGWLSLINNLVNQQKTHGVGLQLVNIVPYMVSYYMTDTNTQAKADLQWALANYFMVKYNHTHFWFGNDNNYGNGPLVLEQREIDPKVANNANAIGHPVDKGHGIDYYASQNVYMRDFSNGLVIVNPSPSSSFTVSLLANTYKDLYGTAIGTTSTLQPASGIVLLGG